MEDRFAFVKFTNNVVEQNAFSQNNSICTESASTHQVLQKPLQKTISTQLFSNVWLTFMCNVAGIIHFYATFRDIGTDVMNIYKEDTLYIVNVTLCDFFNGCGKLFWSYFCIFVGRGKICIVYDICIRILTSTKIIRSSLLLFLIIFHSLQTHFLSSKSILLAIWCQSCLCF